MSIALMIVVGLLYAAVAVAEAFKGNMGMVIVFTSYAAANVDLIMVSQ